MDRAHGSLVHQLTILIKFQPSKIQSTAEISKPEPFSYDLIVNAHRETDGSQSPPGIRWQS
jgi:hypothetical protein